MNLLCERASRNWQPKVAAGLSDNTVGQLRAIVETMYRGSSSSSIDRPIE